MHTSLDDSYAPVTLSHAETSRFLHFAVATIDELGSCAPKGFSSGCTSITKASHHIAGATTEVIALSLSGCAKTAGSFIVKIIEESTNGTLTMTAIEPMDHLPKCTQDRLHHLADEVRIARHRALAARAPERIAR